jgi:hypothetical protein
VGSNRRVLELPQQSTAFEVFNVGSDRNNCTKQMIVDKTLVHVPDAVLSKNKADRCWGLGVVA